MALHADYQDSQRCRQFEQQCVQALSEMDAESDRSSGDVSDQAKVLPCDTGANDLLCQAS